MRSYTQISMGICALVLMACEPPVPEENRDVWVPDTRVVESLTLEGDQARLHPDCDSHVVSWNYQRDDDGRIIRAINRQLGEVGEVSDESFAYDQLGRLIRTETMLNDDIITTHLAYDETGALIRRFSQSQDGRILAAEEAKVTDSGELVVESTYAPYFFGHYAYGLSRLERESGREVFGPDNVIMDITALPPEVFSAVLMSQFSAISQRTRLDELGRPQAVTWYIGEAEEPALQRRITYEEQADVRIERHVDVALSGLFRTVIKRNHQGWVIERTRHEIKIDPEGHEDAVLVSSLVTEYDEQGRTISVSRRDQKSEENRRIRWETDRILEEIDGDADGVFEQMSTVYLNASGHRVLRQNDYDGDGVIDWQRRYAYNSDDLRVFAERDQNVDGRPDRRTEYIYDEQGRMIWSFEISPGLAECIH